MSEITPDTLLWTLAPFFANGFTVANFRTQIDADKFVEVMDMLFRAGFNGAVHERNEFNGLTTHEAKFWTDTDESRASVEVTLWWYVPEIRPASLAVVREEIES